MLRKKENYIFCNSSKGTHYVQTGVYRILILTRISENYDVKMWIEFNWLGIRSNSETIQRW